MSQRRQHGYRLHDNLLHLEEEVESMLLSEDYWAMFRDRYGCDLTIQIKKYESVQELVPRMMKKGRVFSAFPAYQASETTWFEANEEILKLPRKLRSEKE